MTIHISHKILNPSSMLPIVLSGGCLSLLVLWRKQITQYRLVQQEKKLQQTVLTLGAEQQHAIEMLYKEHEEALEQVENIKDETFRRFLENLEHELRNDLATIKSALSNLGDVADISPLTSYKTIVTSIEKLRDLITELRQISEASDLLLQQEINIIDLVTAAVEISHERLASSKRQIILRLPDEEIPWPLSTVCGDYKLLSRAINKLLENAEKYGRDENIYVTIAEDSFSTQSFVKIEVIDKGPGIAEEDLPHIFEPLYRSKKYQDQVDGKGVGLALAQTIVKKHGGTIQPRSREGQGTIMTVRIPAHNTTRS